MAMNRRREDSSDVVYDATFFDQPIDRSGVFTVKHGLPGPVFGPAAAEATPLWVADMDLPCAPEITSSLRRRLEHPTFGYTYQPQEMWTAVRSWLKEEHRWSVNEDAFVFSASVVGAVAACLWAFTAADDMVLQMMPLYEPLQKAVEGAGRKLRRHSLSLKDGRYVFDRDSLANDLKGCRMLLLCNPHNPGGRVWNREELSTILQLCRQEKVLVVSDEIWSDWCVFGHQYVPFASLVGDASSADVVTLMAPTKTWNLAGIHCSFLVIENLELRKKYLAQVEHAFLHYGSTFATEACIAAYTQGRLWLHGARTYVQDNLEHCEKFINARCPEVIPLRPEATYLIWLDCRKMDHPDPADFFLKEAKVLLSGGAQFGGASTACFVRMNVAVRRATLERCLEQIASALERRRQGSSAGDST